MRYLITLLMLFGVAEAQPYKYYMRYDSVFFQTANNSEFILKNATRDTTSGVLVNIGGGITEFKKVRAISATQFVVGSDTITITGSGGGGGSGTLTNLTASNNTGQTWTITNPTTTPNLSLALTSAAVGLGNVDNTSDVNKPVSTATTTALALKAPLASPALTGTPTAPTAAATDNSTQVATTAFVKSVQYFQGFATHPAALVAADATTYYFGALYQNTTITTTAGRNRVAVPVNCTLIGYNIAVVTTTSSVTSEASTVSVRINNTTDLLLSNAVVYNSTANIPNSYYAMNLATDFAAGDQWEIKWLTPTWATNPAATSQMVVTLYFRSR